MPSEEYERLSLANNLADVVRLAAWRQITITNMATAGVRIQIAPKDSLPSIDVLEQTLNESLDRTAKALRGF